MGYFIIKRHVLLVTSWFLLLLLTLTFLNYLSFVVNTNTESQSIVSLSWAGYIVSRYASDQEMEVTGIEGVWAVPQVNASSGNGYSSTWVGIGGQTDKTLIQIGTEHDVINGRESYSAWYEMLPNYAIKIPTIKVSPGDSILASLTLVDSAANKWNMQITDVTKSQTFSQTVVYNSTRSSAEWIVERPTINGRISSLANFGDVTFSDCTVTLNGANGVIANFTDSKIHMTNQQAGVLTSVSPLGSDGSSFSASYVMRE